MMTSKELFKRAVESLKDRIPEGAIITPSEDERIFDTDVIMPYVKLSQVQFTVRVDVQVLVERLVGTKTISLGHIDIVDVSQEGYEKAGMVLGSMYYALDQLIIPKLDEKGFGQ